MLLVAGVATGLGASLAMLVREFERLLPHQVFRGNGCGRRGGTAGMDDTTERDAQLRAEAAAIDEQRLLASLLYLLVRLTTQGGCLGMAFAIGRQFELLAAHPRVQGRLRAAALQLRDHWLRCCAHLEAAHGAPPRTH
jgi:hypothetical protein